MQEPKALQLGDKCPNCDIPLLPAPEPTAEQRKMAEDRENRTPFPPTFDTMTASQRAEHGALYVCIKCDYKTRFPLDAEPATV